MSRKMIDYKVEEGKITSIDGYKVGGGEELHYKTIYVNYTMNFLPDRDAIAKLNNGTWKRNGIFSTEIENVFKPEDCELIKKAKSITVVGNASTSLFGDNNEGTILTQPALLRGNPDEQQGYDIRYVNNKWLMSLQHFSSVAVPGTITTANRIYIYLPCIVKLIY